MEKVLLFQVPNKEAEAAAGIFAAMKVRCERVPAGAFQKSIGELAGQKGTGAWEAYESAYEGTAPAESMMIFCDVTEKHFSRALALLREKGVRIDYKAVLTPTNARWNVLRVYAELAREKAEYERLASVRPR